MLTNLKRHSFILLLLQLFPTLKPSIVVRLRHNNDRLWQKEVGYPIICEQVV